MIDERGVDKIFLLGYNVLSSQLISIDWSKKSIINTLNASAIEWSKKDIIYKNALLNADILIPDGISIKLAARILLNAKIVKISGEDLFFFLLKRLNEKRQTCFFLGSTEKVLEKIKTRLSMEYPFVECGFFSPPFRDIFTEDDKREMIININDFSPDILFVGISAPKQEKLIYEIRESLNTKIICNIGAVFEMYAGTFKRPSKFWQSLGLEWFITWILDPKRLKKKEYINILKFSFTILSKKINLLIKKVKKT